jgi:hypothetical protein
MKRAGKCDELASLQKLVLAKLSWVRALAADAPVGTGCSDRPSGW